MENGDFLRALAGMHSVMHRLCLAWLANDMPEVQAQLKRMAAGLGYLRGICGAPRKEESNVSAK